MAIEIIRRLAGEGKSAADIASVIGSTAGSVRVKCCRLKIKLAGRGRPRSPRTQPRQIEERKLVVYLRAADYAALTRKAAHMQKSAAELSGKLLEAIVSDGIYQAVLDDS